MTVVQFPTPSPRGPTAGHRPNLRTDLHHIRRAMAEIERFLDTLSEETGQGLELLEQVASEGRRVNAVIESDDLEAMEALRAELLRASGRKQPR